MKLGLLSAILPDQTYEEVIDIAKKYGYEAVELACWPKGKSERRYAGVSHLDVDTLNEINAKEILDYAKKSNIEIMALGYYPNPLDPDIEKSNIFINHLYKLIDAAKLLGVNRVSTFIGRDKDKTIEENMELFKAVWTPIIAYAESKEVYVGIENCPMYFTIDEWPGGKNLATSPHIWRQMFETIPSKYFGLSYDPSHLVLQRMDYLKPLKEFKDRIFHIHLKDLAVYEDLINEYGIFTYPLNYMSPKIPGDGSIDWKVFLDVCKEIDYNNCICIELEDKAYEDSFEHILEAIEKSNLHIKKKLS